MGVGLKRKVGVCVEGETRVGQEVGGGRQERGRGAEGGGKELPGEPRLAQPACTADADAGLPFWRGPWGRARMVISSIGARGA